MSNKTALILYAYEDDYLIANYPKLAATLRKHDSELTNIFMVRGISHSPFRHNNIELINSDMFFNHNYAITIVNLYDKFKPNDIGSDNIIDLHLLVKKYDRVYYYTGDALNTDAPYEKLIKSIPDLKRIYYDSINLTYSPIINNDNLFIINPVQSLTTTYGCAEDCTGCPVRKTFIHNKYLASNVITRAIDIIAFNKRNDTTVTTFILNSTADGTFLTYMDNLIYIAQNYNVGYIVHVSPGFKPVELESLLLLMPYIQAIYIEAYLTTRNNFKFNFNREDIIYMIKAISDNDSNDTLIISKMVIDNDNTALKELINDTYDYVDFYKPALILTADIDGLKIIDTYNKQLLKRYTNGKN